MVACAIRKEWIQEHRGTRLDLATTSSSPPTVPIHRPQAAAPGAQVASLDGLPRRLLDACVRGMANVSAAV